MGYANYLSIVLGYINFVLIFSVKFQSLSLVELLLTLGLGAAMLSMGVGYVHRIHQMKTDQDSAYEQSRLAARVSIVTLKAIRGTATDEEIEWALNLLKGIAK